MQHTVPLLLLATAVTAQSPAAVAVFPTDHATAEGSSSNTSWPFSAGIGRGQLIYSNWRFGVPNGAVIRRVGIRPDVAGTGTGRRVQLEVWMGHSDPGVANTGTYANNFLGSPIQVFNRQIVDLPTVPSTANGPQTTMVWLTLDQTFTYDSSKELVVDYRLFANDNGNAAFSYRADRASFFSPTATFGVACRTSSNRLPSLTADTAYTGSSWSFSLSAAPASSAGVLILGLSNTAWGAVPLPFPLTSLGATGCSLLVSIDLSVPLVTNTGGSFSVGASVPGTRSLYGLTLYGQAAIGDLFANNAGFVTSNGASTTVGVLPQAQLVSSQGDANATSGSVTNNFGLVSVFEY